MKTLRTFKTFIAVLILQSFQVAYASAAILYVDDDAPAGGNGTSWSSAYKFLQDALTNARNSGGAVTEIRVAEGTYRPDQGAISGGVGNRWASFGGVNGLSVIGGYWGLAGTNPDQRDTTLHPTILTGDLSGNDLDTDPNTFSENSYHVVSGGTTSSILQGFTITRGNANGTSYDAHGGGIGAAGNGTFRDCIILKNQATGNGGAVFNRAGNPRFENCAFDQNKAGGKGGAVHSEYLSVPSFINCTFENNSATSGGAMYHTSSFAQIDRSLFRMNSAASPTGLAYGGALYIEDSSNTFAIYNSLFVENHAMMGAAVFTGGQTVGLRIVNSTLVYNTASSDGGGLFAYTYFSRPIIQNSILWGNMPNQVAENSTAMVTVSYSDIQGAWSGAGNINAPPQFINATGGDFQLLSTSPAKDTGNTSLFWNAVTATDLAGNPRLVGSAIDMGAYEFQGVQAPVISASSPPANFVDSLEDRDASSGTLLGLQNIALNFSEPVTSASGSALGATNFQVRCVRNGAAASDLQTGLVPSVTQVSGSEAGPYTLQLSQRLCLGGWTEIKAVNVVSAANGTPLSATGYDNRVVLGNLPMDITQDGHVLGDDIGRWLAINSNAFNPAPLTKLLLLDQKRDGLLNGPDINRSIQLLNGIGTFSAWTNFDMGVKP